MIILSVINLKTVFKRVVLITVYYVLMQKFMIVKRKKPDPNQFNSRILLKSTKSANI